MVSEYFRVTLFATAGASLALEIGALDLSFGSRGKFIGCLRSVYEGAIFS